MKNAIRLIMTGMLCMMLVAQGQQQAEEEKRCGDGLRNATRMGTVQSPVPKQEPVD